MALDPRSGVDRSAVRGSKPSLPEHSDGYEVWAVRHSGDLAQRRATLRKFEALDLATEIARSSRDEGASDDGAVSVWVIAPGRGIVWAAGQKNRELAEAGFELDGCIVLSAPVEVEPRV